MSEQDENVPLTRRERRLRELGETSALDVSEATPSASASDSSSDGASESHTAEPAPADADDEIEISAFNPDGTPRSRREVRMLREQALAEREARRQQEAPQAAPEVESVGAAASEVEPTSEPEQPAESEPAGAAEPAGASEPAEAAEPAGEPERDAEPVASDTTDSALPFVPESTSPHATEEPLPFAPESTENVAHAGEQSSSTALPFEPESGFPPAADDDRQDSTASPDDDAAILDAVLAREDSTAPAAPEMNQDFDTLMSPPTEPFTVEELRAAEQTPDASSDESTAPEPVEEAPVKGSSKLKFWKRNKKTEQDAPTVEPEVPAADEAFDVAAEAPLDVHAVFDDAAEASASEQDTSEQDAQEPSAQEPDAAEPNATEPLVLDVESVDPETSDTDTVVAETIDTAEGDSPEALNSDESSAEQAPVRAPSASDSEPMIPADAPGKGGEAVDAPADEATSAHQEDRTSGSRSPKSTYSFPDIAPPEEWRSVFDDPATRRVGPSEKDSSGDFDDLISRAVAQEGSTNTTGTSALILPSMPDDTGGLTGPLGSTGDLYVTGSMRLPKTLGETGGHVSLHDSVELDPITGAEKTGDTGVHGPEPVAAKSAVSARVISGMSVVAEPTKEKSRVPMILGWTGGGLLVVVVGIGVWAAMSGVFN